PDQSLRRRRLRPVGEPPDVIRPLERDGGQALGARLLDGDRDPPARHDLAEAEVAVDQSDRRRFALDGDLRARVHLARLHGPDVVRDADHAVRIVATTPPATFPPTMRPGSPPSWCAPTEDVAGQLLERGDRD